MGHPLPVTSQIPPTVQTPPIPPTQQQTPQIQQTPLTPQQSSILVTSTLNNTVPQSTTKTPLTHVASVPWI